MPDSNDNDELKAAAARYQAEQVPESDRIAALERKIEQLEARLNLLRGTNGIHVSRGVISGGIRQGDGSSQNGIPAGYEDLQLLANAQTMQGFPLGVAWVTLLARRVTS